MVTREELIDALEQLMQAVLDVSDLPETIPGASMGVATQQNRTDVIAHGYGRRREIASEDVAFMIKEIWFNITFFPSHMKLRSKPDEAVVKYARELEQQWNK